MSLLETLKAEKLLWQMSFSGAVSVGEGYRGELILVPGKINASGNQNPPEKLAAQTLLIAKEGKIDFLAGYVRHLDYLNHFAEKFVPYCKAGIPFYFFVEDIGKTMSFELADHRFYVFPLDEGTVWNEFCDMLGLEKGDFKGLDAGEKIVKVAEEGANFKPKAEEVTFEVALTRTIAIHKEARGPV
ncbi:hypothetical protein [Thioflexithrix psekupsensis]|uniref:Uncharacterized protein n=1 Tax=Thioflexithrix psekupsensis TaxID=1570016 RepID=A0A251X307_9GAMM|nr:hypothetical protein [Thioflexithrix psekupsensis]OUD11656.1 hypothetical protein TPSD3_16505 [Thioflexithrix psekupsensis]